MSDEIVIFTAINDEDLGQEFIEKLLESGLILSGTIFPGVKVMYVWEGQLTIDEEFKVMLKAREGNYKDIEDFIMKNHPYRSPEIIKLNASFGSPEFKKFIVSKKTM